MFSSVSCFRILPYLLNLNLQYDLHVFLPMQKTHALVWIMSIAKQQWCIYMFLIQYKEKSKADFKVRYTKKAKIKNAWERSGTLKRSTSLTGA